MSELLNEFVQNHVFVEDDEEDQDDHSKIKELHKRRNFLASFCKLIIYNVLPTKNGADVFKHYVHFYNHYGMFWQFFNEIYLKAWEYFSKLVHIGKYKTEKVETFDSRAKLKVIFVQNSYACVVSQQILPLSNLVVTIYYLSCKIHLFLDFNS